jgi:hypothetical protein
MAKKWIALNLLLLVITVLFGRHVYSSIYDFEYKTNQDSAKLMRDDKPAKAPDKVLPTPDPPKTYNFGEFSTIVEKTVFSANRNNLEENTPDAEKTLKPEIPPLAQKPILVGTILSDNRRVALIMDPATAQRGNQGVAQAVRQGDIQGIAQAIRQGDIQGIVQAFTQGDMPGIAQAFNQGGGMPGLMQALGPGDMQGLAQAFTQGGGMQGLMQAINPGDMQGLAQAFSQGGGMQGLRQGGGMQGLAQALSQGGGLQGLAQTFRQRDNPVVAQSTSRRVQTKRVGDTYQGYTITYIDAEEIVLESGSRKEIIPLHEGSKQPAIGKTAIQPTRVVSIGNSTGTTAATSPARGTGSRPTGTQPNAQPTQGRSGANQGNASTQPGATPQQQRPFNPMGTTPTGQNPIRTPFGDIILAN